MKESFIASQLGVYFSENNIAATDEVLAGMGLLIDEATRVKNIPTEQAQGFLFEIIEATRFNKAHAEVGSPLRAIVTSVIGKPHDPVDILVVDVDSNKIIETIQAKSGKTGLHCISEIWKKYNKYKNDITTFLVPKDKFSRTIELANKRADSGSINSGEYSEISQKTSGALKKNGVGSDGTTYDEACKAKENSEQFAKTEELQAVGKETGIATLNSAACGFVIGGAISSLKNFGSIRSGKVSKKEGLKRIVKDSTKTAMRSGAIAGLSTVVRYTGKTIGSDTISKGNIATAIAAYGIEVSLTTYSWVKGEISNAEAKDRLTSSGINSVSSVFMGKLARTAFGKTAGVVGSMGGYLLASYIYSSCKLIAKNTKLAVENANRLEEITSEIEKQVKVECVEFEKKLNKLIKQRQRKIDHAMHKISSFVRNDNPMLCVSALTELSHELGVKLRFENFSKFNKDMEINSGTLVI